ncbi:MAG: aminotransferase class V-fold PLP-dependent enzyme [Myxococcales bacterium]|nr:aminotransferase class V-fold PLP-dependent enzyme [Myxococcales bacterium]
MSASPADDAALAGPSPYELPAADLRRLGHRVVDLVVDYLEGLPARPVFQRMSQAERDRLQAAPLPTRGQDPDALVDALVEAVLPHPMGNGHPRFFAWVNPAPDPVAVVTEALAAAMNPSCAGGDHAGVYLERGVIGWLRALVGHDAPAGGGLLVSGGSAATITALAAARHRAAERRGLDVRHDGVVGLPLTIYASGEVHSCVRKAVELLGLGARSLRTIACDGARRIDVAALRAAITRDRAAGYAPFSVVGSAGTVNTGAVDPLDALADVCAEEALWLHVDGAYGAPGVLDPRLAPRYAGLSRADSLAIDPHKWLSVPAECGCLLVADFAALRAAFSHVPSYLKARPGRGFDELPWFAEYGSQQTRGLRALKLWVTLSRLGRDGIAATVARHHDLARRLQRRVEAHPALELLAPATLSIVCFRVAPPGLDEAAIEALNRELLVRVQESGEAFLSGTELDGRFALRACVLNHRTRAADVDRLVEVVVAQAGALAASGVG